MHRIDAFIRRGVKCGLCPPEIPTFEQLCQAADNELFKNVLINADQVLHRLLPPQRNATKFDNIRKPMHDRELPDKRNRLITCNFFNRILYSNLIT